MLGFSLSFTGLASSPTTTTFTLADLTDWEFLTDKTATIALTNFNSLPNADGYSLFGVGSNLGAFFRTGEETFYTITVGTPQPIPEPLTVLGAGTALGFGATFKRKLAKKTNKK
ncbi:hypothetical protein AsFPU1_3823 [Aphanothece sacrum FPU1]|uniref:PEP-CTERM protein-sorting domain-containing protein n=1 Tax=Aphanothece sacrum FPU1 TaxID=1920663 RepID=A0A401IMD2_APHSA|nr:hypothetical protein AsFPU1_3823 [Aphanothece sacrum FPU1]GBF84296.1 hypothetical protein AsFPU3_1343 [Aphanothece sacrum FPU3]